MTIIQIIDRKILGDWPENVTFHTALQLMTKPEKTPPCQPDELAPVQRRFSPISVRGYDWLDDA